MVNPARTPASRDAHNTRIPPGRSCIRAIRLLLGRSVVPPDFLGPGCPGQPTSHTTPIVIRLYPNNLNTRIALHPGSIVVITVLMT
jgi:hypothetical protein